MTLYVETGREREKELRYNPLKIKKDRTIHHIPPTNQCYEIQRFYMYQAIIVTIVCPLYDATYILTKAG